MNALLQETSSWTDTVDLALCLFIYEVCNATSSTSCRAATS